MFYSIFLYSATGLPIYFYSTFSIKMERIKAVSNVDTLWKKYVGLQVKTIGIQKLLLIAWRILFTFN